ncbi:MAG: hypothetical protein JRJ84_26190 [Deltaproteobacteria bacterium]|nr:hypothetical protein [Deltaproteobacteria bacterium]
MRRGFVAVVVTFGLCFLHADASAAAGEGVCDGFGGQAGGLCNAYCEALDCDGSEGATRANPGACEDLAARFDEVTGGEPLPCAGEAPPSSGPMVHACINGLAIPLLGVDTDNNGIVDNTVVTVPATYFIKDPIAGATYSINLAFGYTPPDPDQQELVLTCDDYYWGPTFIVQVHAWLASPDAEPVTCDTYIILQDTGNHCMNGGG